MNPILSLSESVSAPRFNVACVVFRLNGAPDAIWQNVPKSAGAP